MVTLVEEFKGVEGLPSLVRALRGMVLVKQDLFIAEDIGKRAEIIFSPAGSVLIEEGADDNDMYFVLRGRVQVIINGREYALLGPGAHVGEFSLADPRAQRCATVNALEDTVTAKLTESSFGAIATRHPMLWRNIAQVLGSHLREGNQFLRRPNPRPHLIVCASQVGQLFAQAIKARASDAERHVPDWLVDAICPEEVGSLDTLEKVFDESDLGVIVVAPGECDSQPGGGAPSSRDSLFLYCGISTGALGRERTVIVQPAELGDHSPAKALGLAPLTYRLDPPEAIKSDVDNICLELRKMVQTLGSR